MAETESSQNPTTVPNDSDAKSYEKNEVTVDILFRTKRAYLLLSALTGNMAGLIYMGTMMLLRGDQDEYLDIQVYLWIFGLAGAQTVTAFLRDDVRAALVSAFATAVGLVVPVVAVGLIKDHHVRLIVIIVAVSLALIGFGWSITELENISKSKSIVMALVIGWLVMGVLFGSAKYFGSS